MGPMRRLLFLLPVAAAFVIVGIGLFTVRPAELGGPAPPLAGPSLAEPDERIRLADLRGTPVVLNFWASWCDPCREEAPAFARVARETAGRVRFLGVNVLDGREAALDYVERFGIPYPSIPDASGSVADDYEVQGVPETVFIDADGALVGKHIGAFTDGGLEELVRELLALEPGEVLEVTGSGESRPVP